MMTMSAAWNRNDIRTAVAGLAGCPEGGWGETDQAMRRIADALPWRSDRAWSLRDLLERVTEIDHAGRYQLRADAAARVAR